MTVALPIPLLIEALLCALRSGMVVLLLPIVGGEGAPGPVRVLLSFALAALFVVAPHGAIDAAALASPAALACAAARELVIGLLIGFLARMLLQAPVLAGELVAQELGLKMAEDVDPFTRVPTTAPSRVYEMTMMLVFLAVRGHHVVLRALHQSFVAFPVGGSAWPDGLADVVRGLTLLLRSAVSIAAPIFAVLLCGSLLLALLARAVPELQIMTFGYPLRLLGALAASVILFPLALQPTLALMATLERALAALVGG